MSASENVSSNFTVADRRPMKRFTPPRKLNGGSESESEYSDSDDYSDSSYSDSESYTSSYSSDSEPEDETLQAIRNTARAQKLRAKFEEWEQTQDAKDQARQMQMVHDENGDSLETASNLKAKFEALQTRDKEEVTAEEEMRGGARAKFRPKRFK